MNRPHPNLFLAALKLAMITTLGMIFGAYSIATIIAARESNPAVPTRYPSVGVREAQHDHELSVEGLGIVAVQSSKIQSSVIIGKLSIPLPRSSGIGWMLAIVTLCATISLDYGIIRRLMEVRSG